MSSMMNYCPTFCTYPLIFQFLQINAFRFNHLFLHKIFIHFVITSLNRIACHAVSFFYNHFKNNFFFCHFTNTNSFPFHSLQPQIFLWISSSCGLYFCHTSSYFCHNSSYFCLASTHFCLASSYFCLASTHFCLASSYF